MFSKITSVFFPAFSCHSRVRYFRPCPRQLLTHLNPTTSNEGVTCKEEIKLRAFGQDGRFWLCFVVTQLNGNRPPLLPCYRAFFHNLIRIAPMLLSLSLAELCCCWWQCCYCCCCFRWLVFLSYQSRKLTIIHSQTCQCRGLRPRMLVQDFQVPGQKLQMPSLYFYRISLIFL